MVKYFIYFVTWSVMITAPVSVKVYDKFDRYQYSYDTLKSYPLPMSSKVFIDPDSAISFYREAILETDISFVYIDSVGFEDENVCEAWWRIHSYFLTPINR